MTTLTVTVTQDFSGNALNNIDTIDFNNGIGTTATATFANTQFNNVAILNNVAFDGSVGTNKVVVNGGNSLNASGWTFSSWTGVDTITINGSNGADAIIGSLEVDTINGGDGNDTITGVGVLADKLNGGLGNDTYVVLTGTATIVDIGGTSDTIKSFINRDLADFFGVDNLTLLGSAAASAVGNSAANVLDGSQNGAGNLLRGLRGSDTYIIGAGDTVEETGIRGGIDTVQSLVSYTLGSNVEKLTLIGVGAINGTGNEKANVLIGNAADNILNGAAGLDSLNGGDGNDRYVLGNENDTISDTAGIDTITSTINRSLADFATVENLTLLGGAFNATGNSLANVIIGNSKGNFLNGGGGLDTLRGGKGGDFYFLGSGNDKVIDTGGIDTITSTKTRSLGAYATVENLSLFSNAAVNGSGNKLANTLTGNAKANALNGAAGNDKLDGGNGKDLLTGSTGNDSFIYRGEKNSRGSAADVIRDFDDLGNDRIDLSAVRFDGKLAYKGLGAFTGVNQVHIKDIAGPDLLVEVNLSGSVAPEMIIRLAGTAASTMTIGDFLL